MRRLIVHSRLSIWLVVISLSLSVAMMLSPTGVAIGILNFIVLVGLRKAAMLEGAARSENFTARRWHWWGR